MLDIISKISSIARENNAVLISERYKDHKSFLTFRCKICGEYFLDTWAEITKRKCIIECPYCFGSDLKENVKFNAVLKTDFKFDLEVASYVLSHFNANKSSEFQNWYNEFSKFLLKNRHLIQGRTPSLIGFAVTFIYIRYHILRTAVPFSELFTYIPALKPHEVEFVDLYRWLEFAYLRDYTQSGLSPDYLKPFIVDKKAVFFAKEETRGTKEGKPKPEYRVQKVRKPMDEKLRLLFDNTSALYDKVYYFWRQKYFRIQTEFFKQSVFRLANLSLKKYPRLASLKKADKGLAALEGLIIDAMAHIKVCSSLSNTAKLDFVPIRDTFRSMLSLFSTFKKVYSGKTKKDLECLNKEISRIYNYLKSFNSFRKSYKDHAEIKDLIGIVRQDSVFGDGELEKFEQEILEFFEKMDEYKSKRVGDAAHRAFKYLKLYKEIGDSTVAQDVLRHGVFKDISSFIALTEAYFKQFEKPKKGDKDSNVSKIEKKVSPKKTFKIKGTPSLPKYKYSEPYLAYFKAQLFASRGYIKQHFIDSMVVNMYRNKCYVSAELRFPRKILEKYGLCAVRINVSNNYSQPLTAKLKKIKNDLEKKGKKKIRIKLREYKEKEKKREEEIVPIKQITDEFFNSLSHVQVIPKGSFVEFHISTKTSPPLRSSARLDDARAFAIDLGQNLLMTVANNFGLPPLVEKGSLIKKANSLRYHKYDEIISQYDIFQYLLSQHKRTKKSFDTLVEMQISFLRQRRDNESKDEAITKGEKYNRYLCKLIQFRDNQLSLLAKELNNPSHLAQIEKTVSQLDENINYQRKQYSNKIKIYEKVKADLSRKRSVGHKVSWVKEQVITLRRAKENALSKVRRLKEADLHRMTKRLIDYCLSYDVATVAIGYNEGWKSSSLSKRFNCVFQSIPFLTLVEYIKFKAKRNGINVITGNEAYTSKCSALDREPIGEKEDGQYLGVRGKVFKPSNRDSPYFSSKWFYSKKQKKLIHADVNGAFNIGRKLLPELFGSVLASDMLINPIQLNCLNLAS